ncbi:MAG: RsmE family RNA methyltransferase [Thermoguttaceae bacterium]|jgi:16S rRNA (uracil1498-N3)-methyltransferase
MSDRFFAPSPILSERVVLTGAEAHHLLHVIRARPGCRVTLLDGSGWEFAAEVRRVARAEVELAVLARHAVDRELPLRLTLGVALPKGERQRWLVEKAVEAGVGRLVPLATARGVAQPVEKALQRLRRSVIEATKQCGRTRLLEISRPQGWSEFIADTAAVPCRMLAHPFQGGPRKAEGGGEEGHGDAETRRHGEGGRRKAEGGKGKAVPLTDPSLLPLLAGGGPAAMAIGPEGGFTDAEVAQALAAGWQAVDLGPRILRVETAAIMLAAWVQLTCPDR